MNDTEWYLIGGLIAAGVVIFILLFLLFKRRNSITKEEKQTYPDQTSSEESYDSYSQPSKQDSEEIDIYQRLTSQEEIDYSELSKEELEALGLTKEDQKALMEM